MQNHKFKIKAGLTPAESSVEMDGKPIAGVRRISFEIDGAKFNEPNAIRLEIMGEVEIEGEFQETVIVKHPS